MIVGALLQLGRAQAAQLGAVAAAQAAAATAHAAAVAHHERPELHPPPHPAARALVLGDVDPVGDVSHVFADGFVEAPACRDNVLRKDWACGPQKSDCSPTASSRRAPVETMSRVRIGRVNN